MAKLSKRTVVILLAIGSLLVAVYFGMDSSITFHTTVGRETIYQHHTDWGKVALSLIFGVLSAISLAYALFRGPAK